MLLSRVERFAEVEGRMPCHLVSACAHIATGSSVIAEVPKDELSNKFGARRRCGEATTLVLHEELVPVVHLVWITGTHA